MATFHGNLSILGVEKIYGNLVIMYTGHHIAGSQEDNRNKSMVIVYDCNMKFTRNIQQIDGVIKSWRILNANGKGS